MRFCGFGRVTRVGGGDEVKVGCEQGKGQGKPSKVFELGAEGV